MSEPDEPETRSRATTTRWSRVILAGLLLAGLGRALWLRWVCDDAFISFRYARNLVAGHGLVWNVGERVEGFTNPLWTFAIAGGLWPGLDPILLSQVLGLASYAILLGALWRLERSVAPGAVLPLATAVCALLPDMAEWATGGLETMSVAAAAAAMAAVLFAGERTPARDLYGGALGALLFLLRPDALLLGAVLGAWALGLRLRDGVRVGAASVRLAGPAAVAVAGVTALRLAYYGDWLPNTFYAKSVPTAYWGQGLHYLALLILRDPVLGLAALLVVLGWRSRGRRRALVAGACLATAAVFAVYVVRTGGDFMYARRLVPAVPLFLVGALAGVETLRPRAQWAVAAVLLPLAALPLPVFHWWGRGGRIGAVADERSFYPDRLVALRQAQGRALARVMDGLPATVLIEGGLCMLADSAPSVVVIEANGLTDRTIARQEVGPRSMPGHEKHATPEYLDQRRTQFIARQQPVPSGSFGTLELTGVGLSLTLRFYDEAVMEPLRHRPGVQFLPIEQVLARVSGDVAAADCGGAQRLLALMDHYYFGWNRHLPEAEERRAALGVRVAAVCQPRTVHPFPASSGRSFSR